MYVLSHLVPTERFSVQFPVLSHEFLMPALRCVVVYLLLELWLLFLKYNYFYLCCCMLSDPCGRLLVVTQFQHEAK